MSQQDHPSDEEIERAASVIRRLPRGYLPYLLFIAVTSKIVTPTLELVILREVDGVLQVLLTKRPEDDLYWPGQWHIPGTVIRSTDTERTFDSCFKRILSEELENNVSVAGLPKRAGIEFWEVERGRELDQLFYVELMTNKQLPDYIRFFSLDKLPPNLMRHHTEVIAKIIEVYKREED